MLPCAGSLKSDSSLDHAMNSSVGDAVSENRKQEVNGPSKQTLSLKANALLLVREQDAAVEVAEEAGRDINLVSIVAGEGR